MQQDQHFDIERRQEEVQPFAGSIPSKSVRVKFDTVGRWLNYGTFSDSVILGSHHRSTDSDYC
jgi:hypothetical protein